MDEDEEDQCIHLFSYCKKHKPPSNDCPILDERIEHIAYQSSSYSPPLNPSSCARSEPYNSFGRRGRKEPEALAAASVKRLFLENKLYLVGGYCLHESLVHVSSGDEILAGSKLSSCLQKDKTSLQGSQSVHSMAEKYECMRQTFQKRLAFGKSRIHGFGIFTKQPHRAGDMVIEYTGEVVRPPVADWREHFIYNSLVGAGTYMFRIDNQRIIDATRAGSIAHLINHSYEPNRYSRGTTAGFMKFAGGLLGFVDSRVTTPHGKVFHSYTDGYKKWRVISENSRAFFIGVGLVRGFEDFGKKLAVRVWSDELTQQMDISKIVLIAEQILMEYKFDSRFRDEIFGGLLFGVDNSKEYHSYIIWYAKMDFLKPKDVSHYSYYSLGSGAEFATQILDSMYDEPQQTPQQCLEKVKCAMLWAHLSDCGTRGITNVFEFHDGQALEQHPSTSNSIDLLIEKVDSHMDRILLVIIDKSFQGVFDTVELGFCTWKGVSCASRINFFGNRAVAYHVLFKDSFSAIATMDGLILDDSTTIPMFKFCITKLGDQLVQMHINLCSVARLEIIKNLKW